MRTVKPIQRLIDELQHLPSIGPKSAARLTYFLLRAPEERVQSLSEAVLDIKQGTKTCETCFNIAEDSPCEICKDGTRDHSVIMVVEEPMDVVAIERTNKFNGVYHVLGGVINPPAGIGPEELRIGELLRRLSAPAAKEKPVGLNKETRRVEELAVAASQIREIILATNPTTEGEATAMFIRKRLSDWAIGRLKITRIARGLPTGGDLEYADTTTLVRSLEGRVEY